MNIEPNTYSPTNIILCDDDINKIAARIHKIMCVSDQAYVKTVIDLFGRAGSFESAGFWAEHITKYKTKLDQADLVKIRQAYDKNEQIHSSFRVRRALFWFKGLYS